MQRKIVEKISAINILILVLVMLIPFAAYRKAEAAANMTETVVRLDRLAAGTTTGTVCAKPTSTATEASVQVTFPTAFTVGPTFGDWTVSTSNLPLGATIWPGILTATAVNSKTVTFPSSDLTPGTLYCFNFTGAAVLTTVAGDSQTGTVVTRTSGPADIDTGAYALSIVSSGHDQIVVTATVPPIFTFSLSGYTDTFTGALSSSSVVSTTGKTLTIGTNAANGWTAWVSSANAGLYSASTTKSIATAGVPSGGPYDLTGMTGYVLDVLATTQGGGAGTMTIDPKYFDAGVTGNKGGGLATAFNAIASANGTTDGDVMTLKERAKVIATQAAATDYTDTLTIVAAGLF